MAFDFDPRVLPEWLRLPALPPAPSLPALPWLTSLQWFRREDAASLPSLPSLSSLPTLPSLPSLPSNSLAEAFSVLVEWKFWTREQKRSVLGALAPDIRVADYDVMALGVSPAAFSNENTHTDAGCFVADKRLIYLPIGGVR